MAELVEHRPGHRKVTGLIPGQGNMPGLGKFKSELSLLKECKG